MRCFRGRPAEAIHRMHLQRNLHVPVTSAVKFDPPGVSDQITCGKKGGIYVRVPVSNFFRSHAGNIIDIIDEKILFFFAHPRPDLEAVK